MVSRSKIWIIIFLALSASNLLAGQAPPSITGDRILEIDFDIIGAALPSQNEAKKDWKNKCKSWVEKTKADNQGKVLLRLISCGRRECSSEARTFSCLSHAKFKYEEKSIAKTPSPPWIQGR